MSTRAAPKRCLDDLPESDPLRSSLAAAVRDRPKADFDRVYRGVIALGVGAGGGGGSGVDSGDGGHGAGGDVAGRAAITAGATKVAATGAHVTSAAAVGKVGGGLLASGALAKTFAIGLFGAASVGAAWWIAGESEPVYRDEPDRAGAQAPIASIRAEVVVAAPPAEPTAAPSAQPPPAQPGAAAPTNVEEGAEIALLRDASAAISSDPGRALALVDEAERRFVRSDLGQEREMIRVQALIAAGRRDEAVARGRALLTRNPSSAHRPRLEQLLPELTEP